jgi:hypothetical protein
LAKAVPKEPVPPVIKIDLFLKKFMEDRVDNSICLRIQEIKD